MKKIFSIIRPNYLLYFMASFLAFSISSAKVPNCFNSSGKKILRGVFQLYVDTENVQVVISNLNMNLFTIINKGIEIGNNEKLVIVNAYKNSDELSATQKKSRLSAITSLVARGLVNQVECKYIPRYR